MARPTTEQASAEQPAIEQAATLTDEELQEVAAGAASGIDYVANPRGISPRRTSPAQESVGFIDGVATDASLT